MPLLLSVIKKTVTNVAEDVEKLKLPDTAGGNVKWYDCFEKQFHRKFNTETCVVSSSTPRYIL